MTKLDFPYLEEPKCNPENYKRQTEDYNAYSLCIQFYIVHDGNWSKLSLVSCICRRACKKITGRLVKDKIADVSNPNLN